MTLPLPVFTVTADIGMIEGAVATRRVTGTRIRFTPNIGKSSAITFDGVLYQVSQVLAAFNAQGDLLTLSGQPVKLLANDPGLNFTGLQWIVEVITSNGAPLIAKWRINAPAAGATIDLAEVPPVVASSTVTIVKGGDGANGSAWLSGTTAPASGSGANGDFYFRTTTGDIYRKASGAWGSPIANITGPAGRSAVDGGSLSGRFSPSQWQNGIDGGSFSSNFAGITGIDGGVL